MSVEEDGPDIYKVQVRKRINNLLQEREDLQQKIYDNLKDIKENVFLKNVKNSKDMIADLGLAPTPVREIERVIQVTRKNSKKMRDFGRKASKYMKYVAEFDNAVTNESKMNDIIRDEKRMLENTILDLKKQIGHYGKERTSLLYGIEQWQQLIYEKDSQLIQILKREEIHVNKLKFKLAIYQIEDERRDIAIRKLFDDNLDVDIDTFRRMFYSTIHSLQLERKFYEELDRKLGHKFINDLEEDEEKWMEEAMKVSFEQTSTAKPSTVRRELARKNKELNEFTERVLIRGEENFTRIKKKRGKAAVLTDSDITEMIIHQSMKSEGEDVDTERRFEDNLRFSDITNRSHKIREELDDVNLKMVEIRVLQETTGNSIKTVIQKVHERKRILERLQRGYKEAMKGKKFKMSKKEMIESIEREKKRIHLLEEIIERSDMKIGRLKMEEMKLIERKELLRKEKKKIVGEKVFLVKTNLMIPDSPKANTSIMKNAYMSSDSVRGWEKLDKKSEDDQDEVGKEEEEEGEGEEGEEGEKNGESKKEKKREMEIRKKKRNQIEKQLNVIADSSKTRKGEGKKSGKEVGDGLKNVFESIVVEELKRRKENELSREMSEVKSSVKFRKKRMDLLIKYYQARNVRAKSILGEKEIGELTTQNLIYEIENRLKEQKEVVERIKNEDSKNYNEEEFEKLLKIFAGDQTYVRIKFLRKNKHSQTTSVMIDQKQQVGGSFGVHFRDAETQMEVSETRERGTQVALKMKKASSNEHVASSTRIRKKLRKGKLLPTLSTGKLSVNRVTKRVRTPTGKRSSRKSEEDKKRKKRRSMTVRTPGSPRKETFVLPKKFKTFADSFAQTSQKYVIERSLENEKKHVAEKCDVGVQRIRQFEERGVTVAAEMKHFGSMIVPNTLMEDESTSMGDLHGSTRRRSSSGWDLDGKRIVPTSKTAMVQSGAPKMKNEKISLLLYGKPFSKSLEIGDESDLKKPPKKSKKKRKKKVLRVSSSTSSLDQTRRGSGKVKRRKQEEEEEEGEGGEEEVEGEEEDKKTMYRSKSTTSIRKRKKKKIKKKKSGGGGRKLKKMKASNSRDIGISTFTKAINNDFSCQVDFVKKEIVEVPVKQGTPRFVDVSTISTQVTLQAEGGDQHTQTRAKVEKDWWVHDSDSVEVQASPSMFDCEAQVGPDGYLEMGIQNVPHMRHSIQQFPPKRRRYRNQNCQTQDTYVRKIVRTFDKYIQADSFHKVRFRLLERIPSQEIGLVKVMLEKDVQAKPVAVESSIQTWTQTFSISCQARPQVSSGSAQVCIKGKTDSRYVQVYQRPKMQKRIQTVLPDNNKTVQTTMRGYSRDYRKSHPPSPDRSPRSSGKLSARGGYRSHIDQMNQFSSQKETIRQLEMKFQSSTNKLDSMKEQHKKHVIELKKRFQDEMMKKDHNIKTLKRENLSNSQIMDDYKREIDSRARDERERLFNTSTNQNKEMKKHVTAQNRRLEADYELLRKKFSIQFSQHKDRVRVEYQKKEKEFDHYKTTLLKKYEDTVKQLERERSHNLGMKRNHRALRKEYEEVQDVCQTQRKKYEEDIRNCKVKIRYLNRVIKENREENVKSALLHRVDEVVVSEMKDIRDDFSKKIIEKENENKIRMTEVNEGVRDQFRVRDDRIQKLRYELCQREEEVENIIEAQRQDSKNLMRDLNFLKDLLSKKDQELERLRKYISTDMQRPATSHSQRPTTGSSTGGTRPSTGYSTGRVFRKRSPDLARPATSSGRTVSRVGPVYQSRKRPKTASSPSASSSSSGLPTIQFKRPKTSAGLEKWEFFDEANSTRRRVLGRKRYKQGGEGSEEGKRVMDNFPNFNPVKKSFSGSFYKMHNKVKNRNKKIVGRSRSTLMACSGSRGNRTRPQSGSKRVRSRKASSEKKKLGTFCLSGISLDL